MESIIPLSTLPLFLTASLALLLIPGPAVMYILAGSIEQGRKAGYASVAGIELANLGHVLAATLGLSAILLSSALAFDIVKYLGAGYLIYLGVRKLMDRNATNTTFEKRSMGRIFRQGLLVNILNPKVALFFFAFLPQFVDANRGPVGPQFLVLGLMFVAMATITDSIYATLAGTFGTWLRGNLGFWRFQRYFSGIVYILLGLTTALASGNKK